MAVYGIPPESMKKTLQDAILFHEGKQPRIVCQGTIYSKDFALRIKSSTKRLWVRPADVLSVQNTSL